MQSNVILFFSLLLGLLWKMLPIVALYRILCKRVEKSSHALLLAWMFAYLYMMAAMLLLSVFRWVSGIGIAVMMVLGALIALLYGNRKEFSIHRPSFPRLSPLAWVGMMTGVTLLGWLTVHSLYFYDNTWDAIVYGMPRLSLYGHNRTLFIQQNSMAVNVFANEWVGELNCLYYMLVAGNEQAAVFGNVENLVFLYLIFHCFFDARGLPMTVRVFFSILLVSAPAVLGLSMTVKGDLLAVGFLALAYGLFRKYQEEPKNPLDLFSLLCALGLCAGSKIMLVPVSGLMCLLLLYYLLRNGQMRAMWKPALLGLFTFIISCSRYVLNLWVYHTPFMRVGGEGMAFGIDKLLPNLKGLTTYLSGVESVRALSSIADINFYYVLSLSLGLLPLLLIPCGLWALYAFFRTRDRSSIPLHLTVLTGLLFFAISTEWRPWSFRYYLPWVLLYGAIALSCSYQRLRAIQGIGEAFSCVSMAILTVGVVSLSGYSDCRPVSYATAASTENQLQRKLVGHPSLYESLSAVTGISDAMHGPADVLILHQPDRATYPYMGDNYQNNVQFTATVEEFFFFAVTGDYDCLVVAGAQVSGAEYIKPALVSAGYDVIAYPSFDSVVYYRGDSLEIPVAYDPAAYDYLDRISTGVYPAEEKQLFWLEDRAWLGIQAEGLKDGRVELVYFTYADRMLPHTEESAGISIYFDGVLVHQEQLTDNEIHTVYFDGKVLPETDQPYYLVEIITNGIIDPLQMGEDGRRLALQLRYLGPAR